MNKLRSTILILLLGVPTLAAAQTLPDPVQYSVAPETPGPNSPVTIEIGGVGSFLGNSTITWKKDGTIVAQGAGMSRYSFTTGPIGKTTSISITIVSSTQGTITKEFTFNPSAANLVWEANTTVPPFYKGKALYSAGSPLRVMALPVVLSGGNRIAASALSYQWSVNDTPQPSSSGLGRSSLYFIGDPLNKNEDVSVNIYYGAAKVAQGEVIIPAVSPKLVIYKRDPLRGLILDVAFPSSVNLLGSEITVQAVPFYFSKLDSTNSQLQFSWQLNGNDVSGPDSNNGILTLRQTGAGQGSADLGVGVQDNNSDNILQNAAAGLSIFFGGQSSLLNNFFGL